MVRCELRLCWLELFTVLIIRSYRSAGNIDEARVVN